MKHLITLLCILTLPLLLLAQVDTVWTRNYAEWPGGGLRDIVPAFDGGYIVTGLQESIPDTFTYITDMITFRVDANGNPDWSFELPGTPDTSREGVAICQSHDNAYLVLSSKRWDTLGVIDIVKLDLDGNLLWHREYDFYHNFELAYHIVRTVNNTYFVTASAEPWDPNHVCGLEIFLMEIDAIGDTLWTSRFPGACIRAPDYLVPTADGGCLIVAHDQDGAMPADGLLIRVDEFGNLEWEMELTGPGSAPEAAIETADGCFYLTGSNIGGPFLQKRFFNGIVEWTQFYPEYENHQEYPDDLVQTADGGFLISGHAHYPNENNRWSPLLIKTDAEGNLQWRQLDNFGDSHFTAGSCLCDDGSFALAGDTWIDYGIPSTPYVIKYEPVNVISSGDLAVPTAFRLYPVYPNPFNGVAQIRYDVDSSRELTLRISDILGREVTVERLTNLTPGAHTYSWTPSGATGLYFIQLDNGTTLQTTKALYLK